MDAARPSPVAGLPPKVQAPTAQDSEPPRPPLAVGLDHALVRCNLMHESVAKLALRKPGLLARMLVWRLRGREVLAREVSARVETDAAHLPYDTALLEWLRAERAQGRPMVLRAGPDPRTAQAVAAHLGLFDAVVATDAVADPHAPAPVPVEQEFRPQQQSGVQSLQPLARLVHLLRAMRLYQWVKNLLVFLPLLGAHQIFNLPLVALAGWAFLAFGLCASSVYLLNDLADLDSDRRHPRKRHRPFAAGQLSVPAGLAAMAACVAAAFAVAALLVGLAFTAWLAVYLALTLCYSFWLKRKILVDSLVLAGLYTLRVLAGSAAVGVATGFWLLAFSMFLFFSLALVKRYSELRVVMTERRVRVPGRDYLIDDLPLVQTLGICSGFCAVMVMALYIDSDAVARLYPHQEAVWATVPLLMYWVSRVWLKAHRGEMEDDPIVFAMSDNISRITIALFFGALALAAVVW